MAFEIGELAQILEYCVKTQCCRGDLRRYEGEPDSSSAMDCDDSVIFEIRSAVLRGFSPAWIRVNFSSQKAIEFSREEGNRIWSAAAAENPEPWNRMMARIEDHFKTQAVAEAERQYRTRIQDTLFDGIISGELIKTAALTTLIR